MRRLLLTLLLALTASPAWAACAYVQKAEGAWSSGASYTASITPTAGNLLAVGVIVQSGNSTDQFSSIADGTNTYTAVDTQNLLGSGVNNGLRTFYVKNVAGGATTITVSLASSTIATARVLVVEFSGADTASPLDKNAINNQANPGTGADAVTSGAQTTTANGECIYGISFSLQGGTYNYSAGTGFTIRSNFASATAAATETQIQAAAGSIAATFTVDTSGASDVFYTALMTFKAAATASTRIRRVIQL